MRYGRDGCTSTKCAMAEKTVAMEGECELDGNVVSFAARPIHLHLFAGEVHVHVSAGRHLATPVTIIVPGEWRSDAEACKAAADYAALMARTGALRLAVKVRELARDYVR